MGINSSFAFKTEDIAFYFILYISFVMVLGGMYSFNKAECKFSSELLI